MNHGQPFRALSGCVQSMEQIDSRHATARPELFIGVEDSQDDLDVVHFVTMDCGGQCISSSRPQEL